MLAGLVALVAASLMASPAYAATTLAEVKTTSDGLRYAVGDFVRDNCYNPYSSSPTVVKVYVGSPQERASEVEAEWNEAAEGAWTSVAEYCPSDYSSIFTIKEHRIAGSATSTDFDPRRTRQDYVNCGRGVYVLGVQEDDGAWKKDIVVPGTIEGLPVVYVNTRGMESVDLSQCASLKHFTILRGNVKLGAANASSLTSIVVNAFDQGLMDSIDLSAATNAREVIFRQSPGSFQLPSKELRSLAFISVAWYPMDDGGSEVEQVSLTDCPKLEKLCVEGGSLSIGSLNMTGCRALKDIFLRYNCMTSFDVSQFPALRNLDLSCNFISDLTQLKAWGAQAGHALNVEDQLTPEQTISPSAVTLSDTSFVYDGKEKCPTVTIPGLKLGFDYRVDYRDNVQAGTATVYVTGLRSYRGSVISKTFSIVNQNSNTGTTTTPASISLAKASVSVKAKAWTGKTLKPVAPTLKVGGKTLRNGVDYTWSCKGGKAVGSYKVTITGKGAYAGTKTATFKVVPKATSASKPTAAKKAFTVKWKKPSKAALKQVTGYQVRWSTSKKFTAKTTKVKAIKKTTSAGKKCSLKVSKLKAKKTYYVQVRTYKKVGKATYYSAWSKAKTVKTKK